MGEGFLKRMALPFVAARRTIANEPGGVGDVLRHSFKSLEDPLPRGELDQILALSESRGLNLFS
jgi:hypothetical protein